MIIEIGSVDSRVTAPAETGPCRQTASMAAFSNRRKIGLGMTAQTQIAVAGDQHFIIHRAMHLMTRGATLPHDFMLPHERSSFIGMTLKTGLIDIIDRGGGR